MAKKSLSWMGLERGLLGVIKEPPSPIASFDNKNIHTAFLYSGLVLIISTIAGFIFSLPVMAFPIIFSMVGVIASLTFLDAPDYKRDIRRGIRSAAQSAVNGDDVSLTNRIAQSFYGTPDFVYNPSFNQKRWIAREWEKEFKRAVDRKAAGSSGKLDDIVDIQKTRAISAKLKELENLRNESLLTEQEKFEAELRK